MAMQITEEERLEALVPLHEPLPSAADLARAVRRIEVRLEIMLEKLDRLLEEVETRNNIELMAEYGRGEESGEGG